MELRKIFFLIMAIILLPFAACARAKAIQSNPTVITRADNGKHITLLEGQSFEVRLDQFGATGYAWQIVNLDKAHLKLLSANRAKFRGTYMFGTPFERIWKIEAVKAGQTGLSILLWRPWKGARKAKESFKLTITIK